MNEECEDVNSSIKEVSCFGDLAWELGLLGCATTLGLYSLVLGFPEVRVWPNGYAYVGYKVRRN